MQEGSLPRAKLVDEEEPLRAWLRARKGVAAEEAEQGGLGRTRHLHLRGAPEQAREDWRW